MAAAESPTTPRGARWRRGSASGSAEPVRLTDHVLPTEAYKHAAVVEKLLREVTKGAVEVVSTRLLAHDRTEFVLSLNSFDHETALRAGVAELRFPWSIEKSDSLGKRHNPNALAGVGEAGYPTLVIVRQGLYEPLTRPCTIILAVATAAFLVAFALSALYWLWDLYTRRER